MVLKVMHEQKKSYAMNRKITQILILFFFWSIFLTIFIPSMIIKKIIMVEVF